jgi:hypothetical protein
MRRLLALTVLALLQTAPAAAADLAAVRALLETAGVPEYLASIERDFREPPPAVGEPTPEFRADWQEAARAHVRLTEAFDEIAARVAAALPDADVAEMERFFGSALGRRITALEVAAQAEPDRPESIAEGARLVAAMAAEDPERARAFADIERALGLIDGAVAAALNLNFAMVAGMVASGLMPAAPSDAEILELLQQDGDAARAEIGRRVLSRAAWTYRELPTAELRLYADFLGTPAARALYGAMEAAQLDVLSRQMRAFGNALMLLSGARRI